MEKIDILSLVKKLKNKLYEKIFIRIFIICFLIFVFFLLITAGVVWHFRVKIFGYFASEYLQESSKAKTVGDTSKETVENVLGERSLLPQESLVVSAVKSTNPAVISITISKDVPKYETYTDPNQNPFGDMFPGFNFSIPQYRQNGTERKEIGGGSGFLVSSDGLIVTNKHVVAEKNAFYTVFTNDGKKHDAKVIARDPILDIALIKIEGSGFPFLSLGNSDSLQVGQSVIAIGNALAEFRNTVSVGVISGLARSITAGDSSGSTEILDHVIQTDAAINPGNSGGPLLNLAGQVVGVNVAVAQGSQSIGFALPINSVKGAIESVKATGKIVRPYLGVRYTSINADLQAKNSLSVDYGVLVKAGKDASELAVIPGSPADKAGIVENDIILEIDGVKLDDKNSLSGIIRGKNVGNVVILKILHRGEEKTVQVTLEAAKDN